MEIIRINDIDNYNDDSYEYHAIALGNFDGVHIGHREIIMMCINNARELGIISSIMIFDPHPIAILRPQQHYGNIYTQEENILHIAKLGIEKIFVVNFNEKLASISAEDFVKNILVKKFRIKYIVSGNDFRFGANRIGSKELLYKMSLKLDFIFQCAYRLRRYNICISSSKIRHYLLHGSIGIASMLLGRNYSISGIISKGSGIAQKFLNFPTANIILNTTDNKELESCEVKLYDNDNITDLSNNTKLRESNTKYMMLYPTYGVYLGKVLYNDTYYYCIMNLGIRPTLNKSKTQFFTQSRITQSQSIQQSNSIVKVALSNDKSITLEAHIFDFENVMNNLNKKKLYDKKMQFEFLHFIRPERKFSNLDKLKYQIELDIITAKQLIYLILEEKIQLFNPDQ